MSRHFGIRLVALLAFLPVAVIPVVVISGCGEQSEKTDSQPQPDQYPPAETVPFIDALGRELEVTIGAERIVSLSPSNTELVYAVGAEDRLVGVTSYCNYPEAARTKEVVGGYDPTSIDLEQIISLKPDLVLASNRFHQPIIESLESLEIPAVGVEPSTLGKLLTAIEFLGQVTEREQNAGELTAALKQRVEAIRNSHPPAEKRLKVFFLLWEDPLATAGETSFIHEIIELAGGRNLFEDLEGDYIPINEESLLARNPDVIVVGGRHEANAAPSRILQRDTWRDLTAIREHRIIEIDGDWIARPGPRMVDAIEDLARQLNKINSAEGSEQAGSDDRP